eukprot:PRCOL_00002361-RA
MGEWGGRAATRGAARRLPARDGLMNIKAEVLHLAKEIVRLGVPAAEGADGVASVKFGVLFNDDDVGNYFEALNGTLRAAKRLKIVDFEGQMLLQGAHDDVDVVLLKHPSEEDVASLA